MDHFLPDIAEKFQQAGYTVLLYDHRNWGVSDGLPRNETDPSQQAQDYFDAFDYASSLEQVDSSKIIYWGSSLSGGVAITAAAFDKRIFAVIIQVPFVSMSQDLGAAARAVTPLVFQDRANIKAGGAPGQVPVYPGSVEEAQSGTSKALLNQPDVFLYTEEVVKRGCELHKWTTLQTVGHLLPFEPINFIHRIGPKPLLMVVGENDTTTATEAQLQAFHRAMQPKTLHVIRNVGHFEVYFGPALEENMKVQLDFLSGIL